MDSVLYPRPKTSLAARLSCTRGMRRRFTRPTIKHTPRPSVGIREGVRASKLRRNSILLSSPVEGTEITTRSRLPRTILMIGVLVGLCFSVGEGMRLTPFPVSALAGVAAPDVRLNLAASRGASLHKYGPLDKPSQAQAQKRGKRQSPDCDCPPAQNTRKPPADLLHGSGVRPPVAFTLSRSVVRPADRAPPRPLSFPA